MTHRVAVLAAACATLVASVLLARAARGAPTDPRETPPKQPLVEGRQLFEAKGCVRCHVVRGGASDVRVGPDLGRSGSWSDVMQFAGNLWNHAPAMSAKMHELGVGRPVLSPDEMGQIVVYLFAVKFFDEPGNAARGRELFEKRSCAQCHQLGGRGGAVGPRLDELKEYMSSSFMAQSLWNHGPEMAAKMAAQKVVRPRLDADDVADIVAYIRGDARGAALDLAYAQAGSPQAGRNVFRQSGCIQCHSIGGKGGTVAPDLGAQRPRMHVGEMAAALWNHGPPMWAKMAELHIQFPRLTDAEMADLIAYLYFVQYMGHGGNATRGRDLFREKSCADCHAAGGEGLRGAADLIASSAVQSPFNWAAAVWKHPIDTKAGPPQPAARFDGDEMRDLVEFLQTPGTLK